MAMSGASPNHSPKPGVSSPWSQIVAAAAPPSSPPPPAASQPSPAAAVVVVNSLSAEESVTVTESSDDGHVGRHNGNNGKRPAWNKPSNEASSSEVKPPFMGDDSWPALSESTRASAKSPSPSEPAKGLINASSSSVPPPLQGTGSVLPSPQRQVRDNIGSSNMLPHHHRSFRRSNSNTSSNGSHASHPSAPQGSMAASGSHNHNSSPRDHQPRAGFVSSDHPQQRNSLRNRNGGPHHRGDGAHHHHNYGNRRDQDRDWNTHRNFNGRDNYMSPRFGPRYIRPPNSAHLFPQPPMGPYGGSIGFPELPPQMIYVPPPPLDPLRGVPFVPPTPIPPHAMFFPPDLQLHHKIVNQINYYFSDDNLAKDVYLRQKMDDQGWVPINLIAGFKKVKQLTDNVHIVLDAVRTSSVVEVQGDKIRRQNDWKRWIMTVQSPNVTGSQTIGNLADQVQNIALGTPNNNGAGGLDVSQNRPFGDLNSQFLIPAGEGTSQVGIPVSDHSISARN